MDPRALPFADVCVDVPVDRPTRPGSARRAGGAHGAPGAPHAPGAPNTPAASHTPASPTAPNTPAAPNASAAPNAPGAPNTPGARASGGQRVPRLAQSVFTYGIPSHLAGVLAPGHVVWVPFGRRKVQGVVVALRHRSPVDRTRDVLSIVGDRPYLSGEQVALAGWIARHYMAPLFEALRLMLPPGALAGDRPPQARTERMVRLVDDDQAARDARLAAWRPSPRADALAYVRRPDVTLPTPEAVRDATGCRRADLLALARDDLIALAPTETLVDTRCGPDEAAELARTELAGAPRQALMLARLAAADAPVPREALLASTGATVGVLSGLVRRALARTIEVPGTVVPSVRGGRARAAVLALRGATTHAAVLDLLAASGGIAVWADVRRQTHASPRHLADLESAGLVVVSERAVWRDPLAGRAPADARQPVLSADQAAAWSRLVPLVDPRHHGRAGRDGLDRPVPSQSSARADGPDLLDTDATLASAPAHTNAPDLLDTGATLASAPARANAPDLLDTDATPTSAPGRARACLLHGVTGSGKTELYLRAIAVVLEQGRQAIVLVPEIALTPQTVARFAARFPGLVGVWHSELSVGERRDTWLRARDGALAVIVGSRSAVFAPVPRLGLIVLDEEHADAYKQSHTPRYHARDVALRRAVLTGAAVILGSATPAIETYHAAKLGRMALLDLPRRLVPAGEDAAWADLPPVTVVDMRQELLAGNTGIFSHALQAALAETLQAGDQAILFLNRRGSATFVSCRECGHVQSCPRCRLPLVWHGARYALQCHHCRHREAAPMLCPACGSARIRYFGAGTERIESEVRLAFPAARVVRWDADTTGTRGSHEAILARFAGGEADVLVGTQMIAKGLDLPGVTLVGVVSADTGLALPDIRARERTFQLLVQVAGRAGRSERGGRVICQTYRPEDPAIRRAADHDYAGFFADEIAFRAEQRYPPFARLVNLEFVTTGGDRAAERETTALADRLRARILRLGLGDTDVIGPAPAFFAHERGRARWHIVVRAGDPHALLADLPLGPGWRVDVDPVSLL